MALGVPLGLVTSLLLALLLNQKVVGVPLFRTLVFVRRSAGVAVALLWMWILDPNIGLVNHLLREIGMRSPPLWLQDEDWAKPALIVMTLTGAGGATMVIFLAGLQTFPPNSTTPRALTVRTACGSSSSSPFPCCRR